MKIAFICVNYNNSEVTIAYILNVIKIKGSFDVKIVIVDNASNPSDLNHLENNVTNYNEVVLLKSPENLGYFKGLNLGITWSLQNGYDGYQVIGNNDIQFFDDFLLTLEGLKLEEDELIIAPDVITINGIHENPHVINRVSRFRRLMYDIYYTHYLIARLIMLFYSAERKHKAFDPERKHIYMGIGALYVLTPAFFKYFDKLWDILFLYGEEAVLGGQVLSVKGKILYEPSLKCNHMESATTSKLGTRKKYEIVRKSYAIYKKYL